MRFRWDIRWQIALVILLFLGSLAILLLGSANVLRVPAFEQKAREDVRAACARMAERGAAAVREVEADVGVPRTLNDRLIRIATEALSGVSGAEGGFYIDGEVDQFAGYAFPTREAGGPLPPGGPPPPLPGRDPPPLERTRIRAQARDSLNSGEVDVQAYDVHGSRVVVGTRAVGAHAPPRWASWVMIRVTGPEQYREQLERYKLALGLALAGIFLSVLLMANLGLTLRRERQQREQLHEELRRSEHLAGLGKLLAGVAHEVRNPLAGIRSTVQLWQRLPQQAHTPASLEAVVREVDRLSALVSRLLYFARAGHEQRRPVAVNALVKDTLERLQPRIVEQGVRCETQLTPDLPDVSGSPGALEQVVLNLAANALDAMPGGGVLTCQTRPASKGFVELRMMDTGPGVPEAAKQHLFEPFFTTRPEGTGLGLALCREIVQQHGGSIELEPSHSPGAAFRVLLPAACA